jgi:hypothetical protein
MSVKAVFMTIIEQLEQTVTPAVLGDSGKSSDNSRQSVAHISLLEQFYAILITRLAVPEVYTQLLRTDHAHIEPSAASESLFVQIWQQDHQRHLLIKELAATHHIDATDTEPLLINASSLAYQELKNAANGQYLPAFLQGQQSTVRQYLPVWAAAVVSPEVVAVTAAPVLVKNTPIYNNSPVADNSDMVDEPAPVIATDALHANPSDYRTSEPSESVRSRNQRHDLLVRLLLLGVVVLTAGLIWALFFRAEPVVEPVEVVAVVPVVTAPEVAAPVAILLPAELIVGVDDSGNLYNCTATIGDANLQEALRQGLLSSFGEQANICDLTVQQGVATTLATINIETLPNILMAMRTVPFSRLQLQNDSLTLEAPDELLLQRLLVDVRTLVPTMTVTAAAPIALPMPNTFGEDDFNGDDNNDAVNDDGNNNSNDNSNFEPSNNNSAPITTNNNMMTNQPNQMPSSNGGSNGVVPLTPQNGLNNNPNNRSNNNSNQIAPSGPISLSELDKMVNNPIVSEPAQGGRPIRPLDE